ncbi:NAD(P)/FAD-dependent oxidoreductase [Reyranella sp.]|jgi:cation diffusion facilitator CzcD-associated flavoprotein CzcO|uniref:flavin-containing monooxygenase n=1 Tax=Reyranella sp. TaxID=1929291 RepID=UPI00121C02D1|nr:NAD(P)/FAD-dependent oxidoreductase [Reyranella sp.]TAJ81367.1 MAG: NAD(P)/FAD-dependent oxidoreductase [Reyranella sp.]
MKAQQTLTHRETAPDLDFDAIVIGAGISGLYQLYRLRDDLGMKVRCFEMGTGVGGTWYWNRYPGARFDSESYSYAYSFSQELLNEWDWSEHFAAQPETEKYLNYVADKFELRRNIQFNSKVTACHYQEKTRSWKVWLGDGSEHACRFLVTCIGPLSTPTFPKIEGRESFQGEAYHTGLWPKHEVTFAGKDVAVIGTGATGVQAITEIAKTANTLTIFQRRPNWCKPLHNKHISKEEMEELRAWYPEMFRLCRESFSCFLHTADPRNTFDLLPETREAFWEKQYQTPGFSMWVGGFKDMMTNRAANDEVSKFVARKIRERVKDPKVAELLIPKDHGFGTRRVPQESGYYEVFNQPNVDLVSILDNPIQRITPTGIELADRSFKFDMIVYATGFDAITGAFDRIDIRGIGGERLKEKWRRALETFLGMLVENFPNMFMIIGPHSALGNIPRSIEYAVDWVTELIKYLCDHDYTYVEPTREAVDDWTNFVIETGKGLLSNEVDSWMTGINQNVESKQKRIIARYSGSAPVFREKANTVAAGGYKKLVLD